jgi:tungstate transport system substrate-binding protein
MSRTPARRTSAGRRARALVAFCLLLGISSLALVAAPSHADDSRTLTVVGTSDVFDSHLVQSVLKPGFEAYRPEYTLNYVSMGTGDAIAYAEAGRASALIVHAPSLENRFVASGYSFERYGRAIFFGDYVLLGPSTDPAHVMASDRHDIVGAFRRIAAAGAAGQANFVSRGGTAGTTVAEHAIWSLTPDVSTCSVSAEDGGGASPSTSSSSCPASIAYPSWYHATGLSQGPNLTAADACSYSRGPGNCYVFTDRGTYQYLASTGVLSSLSIVARDNSPTATGGQSLLLDSFRAYVVDPAKFAHDPDVTIDLRAAGDFVYWLATAGQRAVGRYLSSSGDAPFHPDATPAVTTYGPAPRVMGGGLIRVHGRITNVVPGTPALSGVPVRLRARRTYGFGRGSGNYLTATTDASGAYVLTYRPRTNLSYSVFVPDTSKVEDPGLTPVFGDLLTNVDKAVGVTKVVGVPTLTRIRGGRGVVTFTGRLAPRVTGSGVTGPGAHLSLYGAPVSGGGLRLLGLRPLPNGTSAFTARFRLGHRTWRLQLRYANLGRIVGGSTATHIVRVR